MKVTRTITYEGPAEWINLVFSKSLADGEHRFGASDKSITVATADKEGLPEGIRPFGRPLDPRREV